MGNWEMAADILIVSDKTPKVGQEWNGGKVTNVFREHKGTAGMWIIVIVEDTKCFGEWLDSNWKDDGCQKDQTRRYSRKVQAHKRDWDTAGDYVVKNLISDKVENKLVKEKFKDKNALGVWGIAKVEDTGCQPDFHGNDWNDDGCLADGSRRFARQVNDKGMGNWEMAADILISSDKTPKVGSSFKDGKVTNVFREHKGTAGMWIIVIVEDTKCFGEWLDPNWKDDGCQRDQTRRYSRKVQAHKRDWDTAGDYVVKNLISDKVENKLVKEKFKDKNAFGVWGIAKVEDTGCQPDYHGNNWNDDGCLADGSRRYARQVNDKGMSNWELAADILIASDKTPKVGQEWNGGKVTNVFREHKGTAGMWIIVIVEDNKCFGEWFDNAWKDDGCQRDQTRRYSRKVQAHKRDWDTAGDYVVKNLISDKVENKLVKEKFKDKNAFGVWGVAKVEYTGCQPDYHGNNWNDDGCQADGSKRYARQVNDKGMSNWELAADILIASDKTPKVGSSFKDGKVTNVFREHKGTAGMWIIVIVEDNKCLGEWLDQNWKDDGCINEKRRYSRKVQAHKREWEDTVNHLNSKIGDNLNNKKVLEKTYDKPAGGTQGIWSWVYVDDLECKPKLPTPVSPVSPPVTAPVQPTPVSPAPAPEPTSISPVPVTEPTSISPAPVTEPTSISPAPVSEPTSISPAPVTEPAQDAMALNSDNIDSDVDSDVDSTNKKTFIIIFVILCILLIGSSSIFMLIK
jgi:phenylpyruvate tautomerase PptA (4-oxalocrotonate tautomerase family)